DIVYDSSMSTALRSKKRTSTLRITEPATGLRLADVPVHDAETVLALAGAARAAQPAWAAAGFDARAAVFRAAQKWILSNSDRWRDTICREPGKPRDDAQVEVSVAAQSFGFWAKSARKYLQDESLRTTSPLAFMRKVVIRYEPIGLVGVIGPWNYPLV